MRKTDILESLINFYTDGNKARFAAKIGVKPQTINTWLVRDTFDVDAIYSNCEGVSGDFLLSGEGNILKTDRTDGISSEEVERMKKEITELRAMLNKDSKTTEIALKLSNAIGEVFLAYNRNGK